MTEDRISSIEYHQAWRIIYDARMCNGPHTHTWQSFNSRRFLASLYFVTTSYGAYMIRAPTRSTVRKMNYAGENAIGKYILRGSRRQFARCSEHIIRFNRTSWRPRDSKSTLPMNCLKPRSFFFLLFFHFYDFVFAFISFFFFSILFLIISSEFLFHIVVSSYNIIISPSALFSKTSPQ